MSVAELVKISTAKIAAELLGRIPTADDKARMLRGLGAAAMHHWKRAAMQKLRASSRDYVQGLQEDIGSEKAVITLVGVLPNLIERGFRGGDMRTWMLEGPRAKKAKAGHRYLIIPFQHGTPGTSGRNVGIPMPRVIHNAAKQLTATVSRPGAQLIGTAGVKTTKYGERLGLESGGVKRKAREILQSKAKPWHATSIYSSMIRQEKTFAKATQTTGYTTFRVLSEKVIRGGRDEKGKATEHWFHPGIRARRFARDTRDHIRKIASGIMSSSMSHVGKKRST